MEDFPVSREKDDGSLNGSLVNTAIIITSI